MITCFFDSWDPNPKPPFAIVAERQRWHPKTPEPQELLFGKLTHPLKNAGWGDYFPFDNGPFSGDFC